MTVQPPAQEKVLGWARVWPAIRPPNSKDLRAGAWYPIVRDDLPDRVTIRRGRELKVVPRRILDIRHRKPKAFMVVFRVDYDDNPNRRSLHNLGRRYAVCPVCQNRFALFAKPEQAKCAECGFTGEVAWWESG